MKGLDPGRWPGFAAALDELLELPEAERSGRLAEIASHDPERAEDLAAVLAAEAAGGPLDRAGEWTALAEPVSEPRAGHTLGPYRLVRELGRGGMGVVFLAERADGQFEQRVAIKLLRAAGGDEAGVLAERFRAERRILARLHHPSIAQLFDGGVLPDGRPYFVGEVVEGLPLLAHCERAGLALRERLELFLQIADAVHFAHKNLVVHRDLKPSNLLVEPSDEGPGRVKLLDFGIAKLLAEPEGDELQTQTAARLLTPAYAAPEQRRGEPVTTATDVYGLGVILAELTTGERPGARSLVWPRPELRWIVTKATREEPAARYATADALAEDVRRFLAGFPVTARAGSLAYRAKKFVRRHRVGVLAAGLVLATALAGLWASRSQAAEARAQARRAETVNAFFGSLFAEFDPDASRGREPTARTLLERGVERIDRELASEPGVQEELLELIGSVQLRLGQLDRAEPALERAVALREARLGAGDPTLGPLLRSLAGARQTRGDLAGAESLYRRALALPAPAVARAKPASRFGSVQWVAETPRADRAVTQAELAKLLVSRGGFEEAETLAREAMRSLAAEEGTNSRHYAFALHNLAILRSTTGDPRAEGLFRRVLAIREGLFGRNHRLVAEVLANLSGGVRRRGDLAAAEGLQREALAIDREVYGGSHPDVATDLNNLAKIFEERGRLPEARDALAEAVAMNSELLGAESPHLAPNLHNLALIEWLLGDDATALALLTRSEKLNAAGPGPESPSQAFVHLAFAQVHASRRELAAAESRLAQGLSLLDQHKLERHPKRIEALRTRGFLELAGNRPAAAEKALDEALALGRTVGEPAWKAALTELLLARAQVSQDKTDARARLGAARQRLEELGWAKHPLAVP